MCPVVGLLGHTVVSFLVFKGNPLALLVGIHIDVATVEESMAIPLKTRNETTI